MLELEQQHACACGHEQNLHDRFGCAAFLGAYPQTAQVKTYCPCRRPSAAAMLSGAPARTLIVAEVRIRERRGAAIAVCEVPPALELAACADAVLLAMKRRLRGLIPPQPDGTQQRIRVVHTGERNARLLIEPLQ